VPHVPIRTCAGCGRKAPQRELLRFAARDGVLTPSPRGPGRGAYTCRRLACLERALARRAFNRVLRANVRAVQSPVALYTEADGRRIE